MGNCAKFRDQGYIQLPGISSAFTEGITLQAWIHPDSQKEHCRIFDLGCGKEADNIFLSEHKKTSDIALAVYQGSKRDDKLILKGAFRTGTWTQITVTVDSAGLAKGYVDGKFAGSQAMKAPKAAAGGVRHRCYVGKSNWKDDKSYNGRMSELRIWERVLTEEEIAANYAVPIVGDEPGLIGYWPLADFDTRGPVDLGLDQLHGGATKGVESGDDSTLPLTRTAAAVSVRRTIVTDYVPYTAFPSDRPLAGVASVNGAAEQREANVVAAGRYTLPEGKSAPDDETTVTCAVWDVTLCGIEDAEDVSLTFDRDVDLITIVDNGTTAALTVVQQTAGDALTWELTPDVTVRLRMPAAPQLELPCATVRAGGGITRLDFPSVGSLVNVTSEELSTSNAEDVPPPLPADTPPETQDAVTLYLRQVACAAPVAKSDASSTAKTSSDDTFTTSEWWAPVIDIGESAVEETVKTANDVESGVGKALEDVGKVLEDGLNNLQSTTEITVTGAQDLVLYTVDAAGSLIDDAAKEVAQTSVAAIESSIAQADSLCVSSVNAAANIVEIVGTIGGDVFRLVVQGIEEAVAAMRSFIERIGMVFRDLVEWLALLFSWDRFRDNTDTIYKWALTQLDYLADAIAAAGDDVTETLAVLESSLTDETLNSALIGDIFPKQKKVPGSAELEFVLSHVQNALDIGVSTGGLPASLALPEMPVDICRQLTVEMARIEGKDVWTLECGTIIRPLGTVWSDLDKPLADVIETTADGGEALVEWLKDTLEAKIKLPGFTYVFEEILFPRWDLSPLRLIALAAAIPAQILGWKLDGLKDVNLDAAAVLNADEPAAADEQETSTMQVSSATTSSSNDDAEFLQGVAIAALVLEAMGLVISLVENHVELKKKDTMKTEDLRRQTGMFSMWGATAAAGTAVCGMLTASRSMPPVSRTIAYRSLSIDLMNAVAQFYCGADLVRNQSQKDKEKAEAAQEFFGWLGMIMGTLSFASVSRLAFTDEHAADTSQAGRMAAAVWAMQGVQYAMDGTSFAVERSDLITDKDPAIKVTTVLSGGAAVASVSLAAVAVS